MNKPKALIVITLGFPKDEDDTACVPPIQVALKALKSVDPLLNVIVLSLQYPFFYRTYQWHGIRVISFGRENKGRFSRWFTFCQVLLRFGKLRKEFDIVGLLSLWLDKSAFLATILGKRYQIPHFCWLMGQDAKKQNRFVKMIKPKGESLIALSDFIADEFYRNFQILPKHVIPIGIDPSMFNQPDPTKDIDIIGVGSLIPLKQYDLLLVITKHLKPLFPSIKVLICGDGPEREKLNEWIREFGLTANVTLTGELPHQEVLRIMGRSKLLVHTSNYEGLGLVNLEALYAGAKVISFVKPMRHEIENWFHVANPKDMLFLIKEILTKADHHYKQVMPFAASASARAVLQLYGYKTDAIS